MSDETGVYVCRHVLQNERRVALIVHHSDGMWQLTCGQADHPSDRPDLHFVHATHLFDRVPELRQALDELPKGWLLEKIGGKWELTPHDD